MTALPPQAQRQIFLVYDDRKRAVDRVREECRTSEFMIDTCNDDHRHTAHTVIVEEFYFLIKHVSMIYSASCVSGHGMWIGISIARNVTPHLVLRIIDQRRESLTNV